MIHTRKFIVSVLIVSFALLPAALLAKERRGATLFVNRKDGGHVRGELIAVREKSLLVLTSAGDESVGLSEISSVKIIWKSRAGTGFLLGFVGGAVMGGIWGRVFPDNVHPSTTNTLLGALIVGAAMGLVGYAIGSGAGEDTTIEFAKLSEGEVQDVLTRLRRMARMRDAV